HPGRGHGTAALSALKPRVFGEYGAVRLWLDVFAHNPRAKHVYDKLGFREVLRWLDESVVVAGKASQVIVMALEGAAVMQAGA
ncbi:MAG: GNAT family N-acetyltransferase, partial [Polyangiales bacterium]